MIFYFLIIGCDGFLVWINFWGSFLDKFEFFGWVVFEDGSEWVCDFVVGKLFWDDGLRYVDGLEEVRVWGDDGEFVVGGW